MALGLHNGPPGCTDLSPSVSECMNLLWKVGTWQQVGSMPQMDSWMSLPVPSSMVAHRGLGSDDSTLCVVSSSLHLDPCRWHLCPSQPSMLCQILLLWCQSPTSYS